VRLALKSLSRRRGATRITGSRIKYKIVGCCILSHNFE
jgi:hypothetical protein